MITIGNQSSFAAASVTGPFEYALANAFDAFEWFPDKKPEGGWDETDLNAPLRGRIRERARAAGMRLSVHARWPADPLSPDFAAQFRKDLALARDLGASLMNIHLTQEPGVTAFVEALRPALAQVAEAGLSLAIENTPHHTPELFNELFSILRALKIVPGLQIGMCFDVGHANLCAATRNRYLDFVDLLEAHVPINHLHLHENWGDADTHMPLFTGPSAQNDSGIRGLIRRLCARDFDGSIIFETWPQPHSLLNQARDRLLAMLSQNHA